MLLILKAIFTPIFMGVTRQVIIRRVTVASIVEEFCILNNLMTKFSSSVFSVNIYRYIRGLLHLYVTRS